MAHLDAVAAGETHPTLDEAVDQAVRRTRAFARRQRAWFRRDPRITWLDAHLDPLDVLAPLVDLATAHWGHPEI